MRTTLFVTTALLAMAGAAQASVMFQTGDHPEPNEETILFGSSQTGTTITGATDQSHTGVVFTCMAPAVHNCQTNGIDNAFLTASPSFSRQGPVQGPISNINFRVPGQTFTDFIFNAMDGFGPGETVTAVATDGTFMDTVTLGGGQNFLTITATGGETISSISISGPDAFSSGFYSFREPRVSGISGAPPVPEPAAIAVLVVGLLGLGWVRRRG